jgi:hypothetical protein
MLYFPFPLEFFYSETRSIPTQHMPLLIALAKTTGTTSMSVAELHYQGGVSLRVIFHTSPTVSPAHQPAPLGYSTTSPLPPPNAPPSSST